MSPILHLHQFVGKLLRHLSGVGYAALRKFVHKPTNPRTGKEIPKLTTITPDARAALAGDLRYLASRIDSWAARWHTPGLFEFVSGIATETRRIAALPASSAPARERLTDLAAYLDAAVSTSSEFEAGAALRAAAAQLRELSQAADRAALVAGLRALAAFLAAHPDVPVPQSYHVQDITFFPDGSTDDERRAAVDLIGHALGVPAADPHGHGHYQAERAFGPVAYRALTISTAATARADARNSYADVIRLDDAAAAA
jgi:hypothetical protein